MLQTEEAPTCEVAFPLSFVDQLRDVVAHYFVTANAVLAHYL